LTFQGIWIRINLTIGGVCEPVFDVYGKDMVEYG